MSLAGFSLALVLSGTPLANGGAELPPQFATEQLVAAQMPATQVVVGEQGSDPLPVLPAPVLSAQKPVTLPPCPPGTPLPSAPPISGDLVVGDPLAADPLPGDQDAIVVTARPDSMPGDPMVQLNAQSYEVVQEVDEALVGPAAMAYKDAIPKPIRHGLRNFLRNLTEPIVALNFMLQLNPGKAAETVGRFAVNTTLGIGGLFDVAKRDPIKLPYRRNGFANTLGFYGVKPGAYLFLPLIGPTTIRDLVGGTIDGMLLPTVVGNPFNNIAFTLPAATLSALQGRIQIDEQLNALRNQSNDPYIDARDFYLKRRQAEIDALRGRVPYPDGDLPFVNPGTGRGTVVTPVPITPIAPVVPPTPGFNCTLVPAF